MKRLHLTFLFLLLLMMSCSHLAQMKIGKGVDYQNDATFFNPLLPSGPDPWVIREGDYYYYMHTLVDRIDIWRTRTISDLKNAERKTVWTPPAHGANSRNIWAPELHKVGERWYLYYTAGSSGDLSTQRTFVLENSSGDPYNNQWTDRGQIMDSANDFFAIDGTVFKHRDQLYFLWSGHRSETQKDQQIYIARMKNPWTLEGTRLEISRPEYPWEMVGDPDVIEGPEILKNKRGDVFLFYSASGCATDDYALAMLSLKKDGNPLRAADWIKADRPAFQQKPEHGAFGPGHNGFFKSPDGSEDWIIYHANAEAGKGCGGLRSPRAQKIHWTKQGTPLLGEPRDLKAPIKVPAGEEKIAAGLGY